MIRDVVSGAAAVARTGLIRPIVPRPKLLRLGVRTLLGTPTLASAIALQSGVKPHQTALVDRAGTLTWDELDQRTNRLANALLARASEGDKVAFVLRNGREAVECYAGAAAAGLSAVPINTWSTPEELAHMFGTQHPRVIITSKEFASDVLDEAGDAEVWLVGEDGEYEAALAAAKPTPPPSRGSGHVVTHTSGTTGKPKGAERDLSSGDIQMLVSFVEKVPLRVDDTFLIAPPLFHSFAQGMMAGALVLGATLVLPERFDPRGTQELMAEHHVTAMALVPVMLRRMLEVDGAPSVPSLRIAVLSGSALPQALRERAEARYGRIFHDLYGSTEVGWATISTPADQQRKPGSVGTTGRGMTVFTADADGRILPPGEIGRIFVATGFEFTGYTGIESDRETLEGAIEFGDLGYVDEDGYLFVTGRADDMIVSGGENVYPSEVEAVLDAHDDISEAAVVGADDEEYGQVLHAFVVPRDGATVDAAAVAEFVGERLSRYKVPKRIEICDGLPRNATGKVVKSELPTLS